MTSKAGSNLGARICRLVDCPDATKTITQIETIFFEASATQRFADGAARAAFRERWLGRFLEHDRDWVYVAVAKDGEGAHHGRVIGYLLACLQDAARLDRFSDLAYFQVFKAQTARFPAQLHVNLDQAARGRGIGSRLIDAFVDDARQASCKGGHVVTSRGMRNVSFYNRNGFIERAATCWKNRELVFLGRSF